MTKPKQPAPLPTKDQVLEFINESPGKVGKREIARAFHIGSQDRVHLKKILKDLAEEGAIERGHKRQFHRPGALPEVLVVEVIAIDPEGGLVAKPVTWTQEDTPPRILLTDRKSQAMGRGDRALVRVRRIRDDLYEGKLIKRLAGAPNQVLGVYEAGPEGGRLVPTSKREKTEYLVPANDTMGAEPGEIVLAEVMPGRRLGLRLAKVVERLGHTGQAKSVSLICIHENDIPVEFPPEALKQAEEAEAATLGRREDLRAIPFVTIDGEDARDFDDAVFAEPDDAEDNPGGFRMMVAIADVAHYVRPGDPLDRAAFERGNSVYFPDRVVPMLPEALSNGWCSLRPNEDRPVMAVRMRIDRHGNKLDHAFTRGMIRSSARLTYTQVQNAMDGMADEFTGPLVDPVLKPLYGAFHALAEARNRRGTLDLDIPERRILVDDEGQVTGVVIRPRFDSHRLIEEFMILANVCAAEELEKHDTPCMYRVHDEPAPERLQALREFLDSMDLTLTTGTIKPHHFNKILESVKGSPDEIIVNEVVLRSQAQAVYSPENLGHFGLGLRRYAHFTSPIRRYSDLVVHRGLIRALGLGKDGLTDEEMERMEPIGEHISITERRAATAERDATDRFAAAWLANHVGSLFSGRIRGVNRFGLFVELSETGASGLVPISTLPDDYYMHDEAQHALIGRKSRRTYRLGDLVTAQLMEASPLTGGMLFHIVEEKGHAGVRKPGETVDAETGARKPAVSVGRQRRVKAAKDTRRVKVAGRATAKGKKPGKGGKVSRKTKH
ncbi:ribonuclease R [Caenispirillum salinarum]|uniref:ribonuclease R n=1 Tax=Caenispirillum salinarum TaxID=859058 RepID=UPI00384A6EE5